MGWDSTIWGPAVQQTELVTWTLPQTTAGITLNQAHTLSKRWCEYSPLHHYIGKDGGRKSTSERNHPTFTGYRKWFSEGKINIYGSQLNASVSTCICNCHVGFHLGVGEFSESAGCGRAAEEGTTAQALDWAGVVPHPEKGGGACVQVWSCGCQEAPEPIQSLPPSLQHQGDDKLNIQSARSLAEKPETDLFLLFTDVLFSCQTVFLYFAFCYKQIKLTRLSNYLT